MQCEILDSILEQKRDIRRKTDEISKKKNQEFNQQYCKNVNFLVLIIVQ